MSGITLDTLRSLDANKTYYLANSTGQIKEAGLWQKFKCRFGFGDGQEKVRKLIDAVRVSLLTASGETDNAAEKRRVTLNAAGGRMLKVNIETERTGRNRGTPCGISNFLFALVVTMLFSIGSYL